MEDHPVSVEPAAGDGDPTVPPARPDRTPIGPWTWVAWGLLAVLAAAMPVLVATRLFPDNSPDRDDVGYLSQANALRSGELTLSAEEHDPFFLPFLSGVDGDRVVFKYQPAWPALIALSEALTGSPKGALAVTGLASAFAVAALAFEVTQRRRAALAAGFLFATSPWFLIQAGTYLAYPASAALLCGATACVLRAARTGSARMWAAAGALIGLGVFHRPFDAVLGLAPVGVWFLVQRWRSGRIGRDIGWIALGASPFALLFFAYNRAVTGHLFTLAFSLVAPADRFGFGKRSSLANPMPTDYYDFTPGEAWRTFLAFAASLTDWLPGGLLALGLAYLGFRWIRQRSVGWLLLTQGLIFPLAYFVWWGAANAWAYRLHLLLGPLYWFPILGVVAVLGGVAIDRLAIDRPSVLARVPAAAIPALLVVALLLVSAATSADTRGDLHDARAAQEREIDTLRPPPGDKTVAIAPPNFESDQYVPVEVPAKLDGDHLVAMDPTAGSLRFDLIDRFPDRAFAEVIRVHPLGKPFDKPKRVRRDLTVTTGPTVTLAADTFYPGKTYAGLEGEEEPVASDAGRIEVTLAAEPTEGAITIPEGEPVWVVLGIDDFELHYLARTVAGEVQVIEPATPIRRYAFEGHAPEDVIEEVDVRIQAA